MLNAPVSIISPSLVLPAAMLIDRGQCSKNVFGFGINANTVKNVIHDFVLLFLCCNIVFDRLKMANPAGVEHGSEFLGIGTKALKIAML